MRSAQLFISQGNFSHSPYHQITTSQSFSVNSLITALGEMMKGRNSSLLFLFFLLQIIILIQLCKSQILELGGPDSAEEGHGKGKLLTFFCGKYLRLS
jgi:hypothetical protein